MKEKSSFRDPAGQVYDDGEGLRRIIYPSYFAEYNKLNVDGGLYQELIASDLLIPHEELSVTPVRIIIKPEVVPFISYPYEWCFGMLKEAALNTLEINQIAISHGMILKDASAYNMQFYKHKMTLIDTLSFMEYEPGQPWGAYPQFLQHFLNPLLLMAHKDSGFGRLSEIYLDGIPSLLTRQLLPARKMLSPAILAHVWAQGIELSPNHKITPRVSKMALLALLDNLESLIKHTHYKGFSDWTTYDDKSGSYTESAFKDKECVVKKILKNISPGTVCDLGSNRGNFGIIAKIQGHDILSVDSDHDCVEWQYENLTYPLPLIIDLCNPSPGIGFDNTERKLFLDRLHVDTIIALALIHHLCVANNIPLARVAEMLAGHCKNLIIEFVPLEDKQTQKLLGHKHIPEYSIDVFREAFEKYFMITGTHPIADSLREIFVMEKI
jgi:hypothetical protein